MNLSQQQLMSLIFMVGFGFAYIAGKVLEAIFNKDTTPTRQNSDSDDDWVEERPKRLDLGSYNFWVGLGAIVCLFWVYNSFGGS